MPVDPIPGRSAAEIIRLLDLRPHPEGGHFRETFRDPARDSSGRAASTLIYFLLGVGQVSRWNKVDATEVWVMTQEEFCYSCLAILSECAKPLSSTGFFIGGM